MAKQRNKIDYDFSGYATKYNIKCSDDLTLQNDCFKHDDCKKVPLVYNHNHKHLRCLHEN